jgi:general secretion pathway protein I
MTARRARAKRAAGFTLLEVMIAMAILAVALTGLTLALARSVRASQHARFMTQATFLARKLLVEQENDFITEGFKDDVAVKEEKGEFEDKAFQRFRWTRTTEKIRLPSADQIQAAATKLLQDKQSEAGQGKSSSSSGSSQGGNLTSGMGGLLGPVKEMLEQGIRRVTVRVWWDEPALPDQKVEVVTFYTDMRRIPVAP